MTLDTPEAARILIADERKFLEPFMARERSISEVANELGISVEALAYRVRRFVTLGLLHCTREKPRKGRAIRYYQAAPGFQAPLKVLEVADLEELIHALDGPMRTLMLKSFAQLLEGEGLTGWSILFYRDHQDGVRVELAPPIQGWRPEDLLHDDMPALVYNWMPLALDREQAKTLQTELAQLLSRYELATDAPTYLLGLFLVPLKK